MKFNSLGLLIAIALAGCYEPPDRTEVVGNGQGGIELHRVPKDPAPPQVAKQIDPSAQQTILRQQAEIDRLTALVAERDDEISRLIRTPTTQKAPKDGSQN